jgi:putative transposase
LSVPALTMDEGPPLFLIDQYTRECLAIREERRLSSYEVIETLADVMLLRVIPEHIRSDNRPELAVKQLTDLNCRDGGANAYMEPGSPWENGSCESFNGKLRDECLNGEIFYSLDEAQIIIELWRVFYNTVGPHSSPGYWPSAPVTVQPAVVDRLKQQKGMEIRKPLRVFDISTPSDCEPKGGIGVTLTIQLVQETGQLTAAIPNC